MTTANSTKAVPLHILEDLTEWITLGVDLNWWCENGENEGGEVWDLYQRVEAHLLALDALPVTPEENF